MMGYDERKRHGQEMHRHESYHRERRKRSIQRKRQVRRQLIMIGASALLTLLLVITLAVKRDINRGEQEVVSTMAAEDVAEDKKEKSQKAQEKAESEQSGVQEDVQEAEQVQEESFPDEVELTKEMATAAGYPAEVIELLSKNPETVEFVKSYGAHKDMPPAGTIEELVPGQIPHLLQWDQRWGYTAYGTSIVAVSGCGPTCMSMVVAGLTGNAQVTPAAVASYGSANGYVDPNNDTTWYFMREASYTWGVSCREGILSEAEIAQELGAGHPIICSVGPGDFTNNGHFIVLTEYSEGQIRVLDPFSRVNSERLWTFAELESQISGIWIYQV